MTKSDGAGKALKITFLYSEECPSHDEALERLRRSIELERISADVEIVSVKTDEEAERRKFAGSPTILVNGRDIDPPANPYYALTAERTRSRMGASPHFPPRL